MPIPPICIPIEEKLAKPHRIKVDITIDFSYIKCIDAIYPLQGTSGSKKRKLPARGGGEPPAKKGPAAAAAKEPEALLYDKGTIVVAKALPEGLAIDTLKVKFGGSGTQRKCCEPATVRRCPQSSP